MKRGRDFSFLFKGEPQNKRYNKFKHLKFVEERAFKSGRFAIPGVQEELEQWGWTRLNNMIQNSNCTIATKFFADAYQSK